MRYDLESFLKTIGSKMPAQLNKNLIPVVSTIGPILFLGLNTLTVKGPGEKVGKIISQLAKNAKDSMTLTEIVEKTHSACKTGLTMAFDNDALHEKERLHKKLSALEKEVTEFKTRLDVEYLRMQGEFQKVSEFKKRYNECKEIFDLLSCTKENMMSARFYMTRIGTLIPEIASTIERYISYSATRQEPSCLWMSGPPRSGKTYSVKAIIEKLSAYHGRRLTTYNRNSGDDYVSGYAGQDVYVYDDMASCVDSKDLHELLMAKSSNAYNLNMAQIETKGMPFVSKYIIVCSNVAGVNSCDQLTTPVS